MGNYYHKPVTPELAKGMLGFTLDLYKILSVGSGSIFMSPYSVLAALLLANLGASGDTELQIREALGLSRMSRDEVHEAYKNLQDALNAETQGSTTLAIANKMFAQVGLDVSDNYMKNSKEFYNSGLELMDFEGQPEKSRIAINNWVEKQTREKIQCLLHEDAINPLTVVVLINAIYFKGKWAKPFYARGTRKVDFKSGTRGKVDLMNAKLQVKYLDDSSMGVSAVELTYASGHIAMVVLLPDKDDGLDKMDSTLTSRNLQILCSNISKAQSSVVIVGIPKFELTIAFELTKALSGLGILDLFSKTKANLTEMLPGRDDVYVSDVIHKAFIEVNEQGTEAAAVTSVQVVMLCARQNEPPPKRFIADHPFLFLIRDTSSGTILFMGRYVGP